MHVSSSYITRKLYYVTWKPLSRVIYRKDRDLESGNTCICIP